MIALFVQDVDGNRIGTLTFEPEFFNKLKSLGPDHEPTFSYIWNGQWLVGTIVHLEPAIKAEAPKSESTDIPFIPPEVFVGCGPRHPRFSNHCTMCLTASLAQLINMLNEKKK